MKRQRGRNNGRKPHMPVRSQTFDSAGPDVRIRGNAYQVLEKYLALARDASAAGDRIAAENFYQHAEHYYRVINANGEHHRQQQQHQQQQMHGQQGHGQQGHGQGQHQNHGHGYDQRGQQSFEGHQNGGAPGTGPQPGLASPGHQAGPGGNVGPSNQPQESDQQSD
jgi:Domain of unknown function (DUF4167)